MGQFGADLEDTAKKGFASQQKSVEKLNNIANRAQASTARAQERMSTGDYRGALSGAKQDFKSDYGAAKRDEREARRIYDEAAKSGTDTVARGVGELNQGAVKTSEGVMGKELTDVTAPTGVAIDRMKTSREQGMSLNDSYGRSAQEMFGNGSNRWGDAFNDIGSSVFNEEKGKGGQKSHGFFQGLGSAAKGFGKTEGKMIGATSEGMGQVQKGSVGKGANTVWKGQQDYWSDPTVQAVALTAATMGGGAAAAGGYIASALGSMGLTVSPAMATALANAAIAAGRTSMSGGDSKQIFTSMLGSGLGSAIGGAMGPANSAIGAGAQAGLTNAAGQALTNKGKVDWGTAGLTGLGAGVGYGASDWAKGAGLGKTATNVLSGALKGGVTGGAEGAISGAGAGAGALGGALTNRYLADERQKDAAQQMQQRRQAYLQQMQQRNARTPAQRQNVSAQQTSQRGLG